MSWGWSAFAKWWLVIEAKHGIAVKRERARHESPILHHKIQNDICCSVFYFAGLLFCMYFFESFVRKFFVILRYKMPKNPAFLPILFIRKLVDSNYSKCNFYCMYLLNFCTNLYSKIIVGKYAHLTYSNNDKI